MMHKAELEYYLINMSLILIKYNSLLLSTIAPGKTHKKTYTYKRYKRYKKNKKKNSRRKHKK
jgi:hypothetical protein